MSSLLLRNYEEGDEDMELYPDEIEEPDNQLILAIQRTNFDPNLPLVEVVPYLNEVEMLANNTVYIAEDPQYQPLIEVGLNTPLTVNSMVQLIKKEVERLKEFHPTMDIRLGIEQYLNANFVSANAQNPDTNYDRNFMARVLRNIMRSFKVSYRSFRLLERSIRDGCRYLSGQHANIILSQMPLMSDEQLEQFDMVHQLMGRQIQALQRLRSARISGLREVIIMMNQNLHVYSPVQLDAAIN